MKRILCVRTDRLGDVILTLPSCGALKKRYPDAHITFLTTEYTEKIVKMHEAVDEVIVYRPNSDHKGFAGILRLAGELKKQKFDMAFLFYPRPRLALALFLACIPVRVGTSRRWYSFLLNRRARLKRKDSGRHELDLNLALVTFATGGSADEVLGGFGLVVPPFAEERALAAIKNSAISKPYAIIHPGSGDSAPSIPTAILGRLADHLSQDRGFCVVITGTEKERGLVEEVYSLSQKSGVVKLTGLDIEAFAALIAGAGFFAANSTGPLHLARAFDVPLMGFYCNAAPCAPHRWGPYKRPASVVSPDYPVCKTCTRGECEVGNCMELVTWDVVRDCANRVLA